MRGGNVLNYLYRIEYDVGTVLEHRKFGSWIHSEERHIHVFPGNWIDVV